MAIAAGQPAPEFILKDQNQKEVKLSDYRGKNVVLIFYPLDWSPVCTNEHACFVNDLKQFEQLNAQVLGLSVDSVWSHKAFAEKMGIHYPLLADFNPRGAVADKFGVYLAEKGHHRTRRRHHQQKRKRRLGEELRHSGCAGHEGSVAGALASAVVRSGLTQSKPNSRERQRNRVALQGLRFS